jgi:hypothetical protein
MSFFRGLSEGFSEGIDVVKGIQDIKSQNQRDELALEAEKRAKAREGRVVAAEARAAEERRQGKNFVRAAMGIPAPPSVSKLGGPGSATDGKGIPSDPVTGAAPTGEPGVRTATPEDKGLPTVNVGEEEPAMGVPTPAAPTAADTAPTPGLRTFTPNMKALEDYVRRNPTPQNYARLQQAQQQIASQELAKVSLSLKQIQAKNAQLSLDIKQKYGVK